MPLTLPLELSGTIVTEEVGGVSAHDAADSIRFEVKAGKRLWINVDFSHPTTAVLLLDDGDVVDADDQHTIDILNLAPEMDNLGITPP